MSARLHEELVPHVSLFLSQISSFPGIAVELRFWVFSGKPPCPESETSCGHPSTWTKSEGFMRASHSSSRIDVSELAACVPCCCAVKFLREGQVLDLTRASKDVLLGWLSPGSLILPGLAVGNGGKVCIANILPSQMPTGSGSSNPVTGI